MIIGDKIMVKSYGMGLAIEEAPEVMIKNCDPDLLAKMNLKVIDGVLQVPVVTEVPAHLMGAGIGSSTADTGDYDIMTHDPEVLSMWFGLSCALVIWFYCAIVIPVMVGGI